MRRRGVTGNAAGVAATQHEQPRNLRRWLFIVISSIEIHGLIQSTSLPPLWTATVADTMACCPATFCKPAFNE
jgi:hypothetical protein